MDWLNDAKFVAFDFDGTLTDYVKADLYALEQLRLTACAKVNSEAFAERAIQEIMAFHERVEFGRSDPRHMDTERLSLTLEAFHVEYTAEHRQHYLSALVKATRPMAGAVELLHALKRQGLKLALLTNAYDGAFQRLRVAHCFPEAPFEALLVAGELGFFKPDPRTFLALVQALGLEPEQGVYVGDLPNYDVVGAAKVGLRAVLVNPSARARTEAKSLGAFGVAPDLFSLMESR